MENFQVLLKRSNQSNDQNLRLATYSNSNLLQMSSEELSNISTAYMYRFCHFMHLLDTLQKHQGDQTPPPGELSVLEPGRARQPTTGGVKEWWHICHLG